MIDVGAPKAKDSNVFHGVLRNCEVLLLAHPFHHQVGARQLALAFGASPQQPECVDQERLRTIIESAVCFDQVFN